MHKVRHAIRGFFGHTAFIGVLMFGLAIYADNPAFAAWSALLALFAHVVYSGFRPPRGSPPKAVPAAAEPTRDRAGLFHKRP